MISAPWMASLSDANHLLIMYFMGVAFLVLSAGFVRAVATRGEVGVRYRSATVARLAVLGAAAVSYLFLLITFVFGYDATATGWEPNELAVNTFALRYADWSLTVPLLCAELLAVTALIGFAYKRAQYLAIAFAFGMIFTGFLGAIVLHDDDNPGVTSLWFGVSVIFWVLTNVVLIRAVRTSSSALTPEAGRLLRNATILLLAGWVIYPIASMIQLFAFGGEWTTTMQVVLCIADIVVKVGFSTIIHDVAKLRTAEDVRAGEDMHPEAIWIASVKLSDAGQAPEVILEQSSIVHSARKRPPSSAAQGMSAEEAQAMPDYLPPEA
ncbi:MAG: bacteriorhodopsin [Rhodoglobus sp.]